MELMLTITLAALIISVAVPTFIDINRGAAAKQASNLVYANLNMAQQKATITRQRVGFFIVTQVVSANPWVGSNTANRSYFVYAPTRRTSPGLKALSPPFKPSRRR